MLSIFGDALLVSMRRENRPPVRTDDWEDRFLRPEMLDRRKRLFSSLRDLFW